MARTGVYLERLLDGDETYRKLWVPRMERQSRHRVHRLAVARVLLDHLSAPDQSGTAGPAEEHRTLSLTRRALNGEGITPRTLEIFIGAFGMSRPHVEALRALLAGTADGTGRVVIGRDLEPTLSSPAGFRTLALHDYHRVGRDRMPSDHSTVQVLQATRDGLDGYRYQYDTDALEVTVLRGATSRPPKQVAGRLWEREFIFPRTLRAGETLSFSYDIKFHYSSAPPPEFRRAAIRQIRNLDLRVEFHPEALPKAVYWGVWGHLGQPPIRQQPLRLDPDHSVHRFISVAEATTVGFFWIWDPA